VIDKTGTLTEGRPKVTSVISVNGITEEELLALAASVEIQSEHPLATAIVNSAKQRGMDITPADDFNSITGSGALRLRARWIDAIDKGSEHALGGGPILGHHLHGILTAGHTRRLLRICFHGISCSGAGASRAPINCQRSEDSRTAAVCRPVRSGTNRVYL